MTSSVKAETFVVRYHNGNQFKTALCIKKKVLHIVCNDGTYVRHHTHPVSALRDMTIIDNTTVRKAKQCLRRQGRAFGITKEAKRWLKG